jgi:hypothetical protein
VACSYSVWRGKQISVANPTADGSLKKKHVVAGFDSSFWKRVGDSDRGMLLPAEAAEGFDKGTHSVVSGFYQV